MYMQTRPGKATAYTHASSRFSIRTLRRLLRQLRTLNALVDINVQQHQRADQ